MSLIVLQSGAPAIGLFDAVDAETTTFKGGEVCTLTKVLLSANDLTAATNDGYSNLTTLRGRPAVSKAGLTATTRPLFLADDGTTGYGTLFGQIVGGTAGQQVTSGAVLGPHTATGSGKITLHNQVGLYGVSLDALDAATVAPTVAIDCGAALYYTAAGLLTTTATLTTKVATFLEFATNGSVVSTPNSLVAALNSPAGSVGSPLANRFTMALIQWNPPTA
jgi:hypothetical protein